MSKSRLNHAFALPNFSGVNCCNNFAVHGSMDAQCASHMTGTTSKRRVKLVMLLSPAHLNDVVCGSGALYASKSVASYTADLTDSGCADARLKSAQAAEPS